MNRLTLRIVAGVMFAAPTVCAQDIAGVWQGTAMYQGRPFRQLLRISKADSGWKILYYDIDELADPVTPTHTALEGRKLT